ncbi:MAG: carbohydrate-binding domain-containing protein, partial [Fibromonadales bacterium]|nr:carbohydrate-binding domain-containing protein [Fibromonadales bacterium]
MNLRKSFAFVALFLSMVLIAACSDGNKSSSVNKNEKEDDYENKTDPNLNMDRDDLGQEHSIVIKFGNGAPAIDNPYENDVTITSNGENVVVNVAETSANIEYNLIVSGTTTNGSLKIYGQHNMGIFLNSVDITNPRGPAINIQSGGKISVNLVGGTYNYLADGANYNPTGEEDAKGTLFSEKRLLFKGIGSLEVESKYNHAIVVDNDFEMES